MAVLLSEQRTIGGVVEIDAFIVREEEFDLAHRITRARQFAQPQQLLSRSDRVPVDLRRIELARARATVGQLLHIQRRKAASRSPPGGDAASGEIFGARPT